ncbi:hypothetical protein ABC974_26065 [Sphingomonas oligophenolica]|uniref:HTH luxR-type domain-containing protein n=1 Tax=Sphingomonas oligophenolica TaxID=301154 RepID=A0ABU9YBE4_9SPHN
MNGTAACVDPDREELISLIYEASVHPDGWQPFLNAFHRSLSAYFSAIMFRHRPHGSLTLMVRRGDDGEDGIPSRIYADIAGSGPIDYETMESGQIYTLRDFSAHGEIATAPVFTEHLKVADKGHLELVAVGPADGFRAQFLWVRDDATGPLDAGERAWLKSLLPHLERGMAIFARKILLQVSSGICTEALEQLAFGAAALDKDGRILVCNRVADELIDQSEDLRRVNGRLIFRRKDHAQTIREFATNLDIARTEAVFRLRNGEETIGVLARPIAPRAADNAMTTARVIVYLHALTGHAQPSPVLLSKLFGLTPSEAMLAILLSEGATLREAAQQMGITENSARTYSKRIFLKAGVRRQADLVRVILRSVAMFGNG